MVKPMKTKKKLDPTPREGDVLAVIRLYKDKYENSPSLEEIGKKARMSKSTVASHLRNLRKKKLVKWKKGSPRTLQLL